MKRRRQSGQALIEMAMMLPLLCLMVLGTWYLSELARERMHALQAARYAAFAAAHSTLTNYDGPRTLVNIPGLMAKTSDYVYSNLLVQAEMMQAYGAITLPGDIVMGGEIKVPWGGVIGQLTQIGVDTARKKQKLHTTPYLLEVQPVAVDYRIARTPYFIGSSLSGAVNAMSGSSGGTFSEVMKYVDFFMNIVLAQGVKFYGFGGDALITVETKVDVSNKRMPLKTMAGAQGPLPSQNQQVKSGILALQKYAIKEKVSVIGDSWALTDGRDVDRGGLVAGKEDESGYHKQVNRLQFFLKAFFDAGKIDQAPSGMGQGMTAMDSTLEALKGQPGFGGILDARVVSKNYKGKDGEITQDVGFGRSKYWTSDIPANAVERRGQYFMGCKKAQGKDCD